MKHVLPCSLLVLAVFLVTSGPSPHAQEQPPANASAKPTEPHVIEVTAKKYNFDPSPIHVKQGSRVQLKITATDHTHGFKIDTVPEGGSGEPGLLFSSGQECYRIEKHQTATIEFTAQKAGTYRFKCCVHCGWDHRSMKGELIVEP